MKILHINTKDTGGAANACMRIHKYLLNKGIDSKVLVLRKTKNIPEVYQYSYWDFPKSRIDTLKRTIKLAIYERHLRNQRARMTVPVEILSYPTTIYDITEHPFYKEADIIQLNWVSGFLDEPSFFKKNTKPVIWRMADLYICGGGNHYEKEFPFNAYQDILNKNYIIRKASLEGKKINLVAISNWTKQKALDCELLKGQPITIIQNGIDTNIFKQYNKKLVREALGLPLDKKIILFGADVLSVPRKGMHLLLESINSLTENRNILFCAFGNTYVPLKENILPLGPISDEILLAMIYSAADLFIMPSIEETFGQVILESLACGTPIVSFPTGGALDTIKDNFNGFLAKDFTSKDLTAAIEKALSFSFNRDEIRNDIIKNFNVVDKADLFIDLYTSILNHKS